MENKRLNENGRNHRRSYLARIDFCRFRFERLFPVCRAAGTHADERRVYESVDFDGLYLFTLKFFSDGKIQCSGD